jgi:preprotein translocase subunit YajC
MYFLVIRPQNKQKAQREAFLSTLKVGDKVVTGGGIQGKITGVQQETVTVEISDRVRVKVIRGQVNPVAAAPDDQTKENEKK